MSEWANSLVQSKRKMKPKVVNIEQCVPDKEELWD